MKKIISMVLLLVMALMIASLNFAVFANDETEIIAYKGTPVLDGKIDEIYKVSGSTITNSKNQFYAWGTGKENSDISSTTYMLYDDNYLYIATEVKNDKNIVDAGIADGWKADSVEFWIMLPDASKNAKIAVDAFKTDIYGNDYPYFDQVKAEVVRGTDSYVVEVALPLTFKATDTVGCSIQVNDIFDTTGQNGAAYGVQKSNKTLKLSDKTATVKTTTPAATTPAAATTTTAAQTADAGIILAAVSMAMSACTAVVLKKRK